jgi:hypothetical protein
VIIANPQETVILGPEQGGAKFRQNRKEREQNPSIAVEATTWFQRMVRIFLSCTSYFWREYI